MNSVHILNHLVWDHQVLAYLLIFIGLIVEGEVVVITAGVLSYLGALDFWLALCFILAGGMVKTFGGYYLGVILQEKYSQANFLKYLKKRVLYFMPRFRERPFWSIFVSKFIMGANHFVIIFCGYEKIDYKKFLRAEISSTVIWAPLLLSLGYFFSYAALHVTREIWRFLMIVFIFYIIFVLFDKLVSWIYEMFEEFYDEN